MPDNTQWWLNPTLNGTRATSNNLNIPAYERVSSIPSWLPGIGTNELANEYRNTGKMFDTSAYDAESAGQQSRLLTTALNAGNNAATEYANRARQSGGSGMGAGLIKAQASVGARKSAGEMALETKKFDASQREKAAGHAAQIASTLGSLRDSYLKTMVDYATKEDSTMADYTAKMAALGLESNKLNASRSGMAFSVGKGLGRGSTAFDFGSNEEADKYLKDNAGQMTSHGFVPASTSSNWWG